MSTLVSSVIVGYGRRALSYVRAVAFWVAIVSPIALVVALLAGFGGERPLLFVGLLLGSVTCTIVGHDHDPD